MKFNKKLTIAALIFCATVTHAGSPVYRAQLNVNLVALPKPIELTERCDQKLRTFLETLPPFKDIKNIPLHSVNLASLEGNSNLTEFRDCLYSHAANFHSASMKIIKVSMEADVARILANRKEYNRLCRINGNGNPCYTANRRWAKEEFKRLVEDVDYAGLIEATYERVMNSPRVSYYNVSESLRRKGLTANFSGREALKNFFNDDSSND